MSDNFKLPKICLKIKLLLISGLQVKNFNSQKQSYVMDTISSFVEASKFALATAIVPPFQ